VNSAAEDTDKATGVLDGSAHALSNETGSVAELLENCLVEVNSFEKIVRGEKDTTTRETDAATSEEDQTEETQPEETQPEAIQPKAIQPKAI
jgi:hypothetical protein